MRLPTPILLLALLGLGCPSADDDDSAVAAGFDPDDTDAVLLALGDSLANRPAHGCQVGLARGDGATWVGAAGINGPEGAPLAVDVQLGLASVSKTYTAGLVLELVDEGLIGLDDPLSDFLPGVHPRADDITVRMLLLHTAGIPGSLRTPEAQAQPTRAWTEDELFAFVADDPLVNEPGASYAYSNTHYTLLARIAQAAAGAPWRDLVQDRLLDPLGLAETRVPALGADWGDIASSWYGNAPFPTITHPQAISAAGNFVGTASDVAAWGQARFGGGLHSAELTSEQTEGVSLGGGFTYGLGLVTFEVDGELEIGHDGALNGFATWLGHRPDRDTTIAVLCNAWGGGNPPDFSYPMDLSRELWDALPGGS